MVFCPQNGGVLELSVSAGWSRIMNGDVLFSLVGLGLVLRLGSV